MAITEKGAARDGDGDSVGGAVDLRRGGKGDEGDKEKKGAMVMACLTGRRR